MWTARPPCSCAQQARVEARLGQVLRFCSSSASASHVKAVKRVALHSGPNFSHSQVSSKRARAHQGVHAQQVRRRLVSTLARFETSCEAYVAGIPVAPAATAAGQRLRGCLREQPHEFVQTALQELKVCPASSTSSHTPLRQEQTEHCPDTAIHAQDLCAELPGRDLHTGGRGSAEEGGAADRPAAPQPDRAQPLEQSWLAARDVLCEQEGRPGRPGAEAACEQASDDAAASSSGGGAARAAPPAAPGAGRAGLLEDVMYAWMLAEAYLEHPLLHSDMRCPPRPALPRPCCCSLPGCVNGVSHGSWRCTSCRRCLYSCKSKPPLCS
jgi:hypothetical protein